MNKSSNYKVKRDLLFNLSKRYPTESEDQLLNRAYINGLFCGTCYPERFNNVPTGYYICNNCSLNKLSPLLSNVNIQIPSVFQKYENPVTDSDSFHILPVRDEDFPTDTQISVDNKFSDDIDTQISTLSNDDNKNDLIHLLNDLKKKLNEKLERQKKKSGKPSNYVTSQINKLQSQITDIESQLNNNNNKLTGKGLNLRNHIRSDLQNNSVIMSNILTNRILDAHD